MTVAGDTNDDAAIEAQLYCRMSTSTAAAVDRYHDDLVRLRSMGVVEEVDVTGWPSRIELRDGDTNVVEAAFEEFSSWADEEGVDLEPAFNVDDYASEFTGETGTRLITPVACLALYRDDGLLDVYPHVNGDEVRTVEDGIEDLEESAVPTYPAGNAALADEPAE